MPPAGRRRPRPWPDPARRVAPNTWTTLPLADVPWPPRRSAGPILLLSGAACAWSAMSGRSRLSPSTSNATGKVDAEYTVDGGEAEITVLIPTGTETP